MTLLKKVNTHCTAQKNAGATTLSIYVATVQHMQEHGDWTPLAALIAKSQPKVSGIVRKLANKTLIGWKLMKDANNKDTGGLRMVKVKTENQGFDESFLRKVSDLVGSKATIQSKLVGELFERAVQPEKTTAELLEAFNAYAKRFAKTHNLPLSVLVGDHQPAH